MLNHTKTARRFHRQNRINKSLYIIKNVYCLDEWADNLKGEEGRLAKAKVHCSCPMCRRKSYDYLKASDNRRIIAMEQEIKNYLKTSA